MDCSDWGMSVQQEFDSSTNLKNCIIDPFSFEGKKVVGGDVESFVFGGEGKTFVVSSELGGNIWKGFVGVYASWTSAESDINSPLAYFVDNSTTFSCAASLSDTTIVCGADKGTLECMRYTVGDNFPDIRIYQSFVGHDDVVSSLGISLNADHIVSCSFDTASKSWDIESGACVSTSDVTKDKLLCLATCPNDNNLYCVASRDGKVYLLDDRLCSGVPPSVLESSTLLRKGAYPTALIWPKSSPNCVFVGYSDGNFVSLDLKRPSEPTTQNQQKHLSLHLGGILTLDVHPENPALFVSGSEDGNICIADLTNSGKYSVVGKHAGAVRCVKWSREGLICSAGWDGKLRSFNVSNLQDFPNGHSH